MKVFLSWSTSRSQAMALVFRDWLPNVIQSLQPWVSSEDISKGARWSHEIERLLDETKYGLVCVTPENVDRPWLAFETGALAKSVRTSRVAPVLLGLEPHQLNGPLALFQATRATDRRDMFRLVRSLNESLEIPLAADRLSQAFERVWPELADQLGEVEALKPGAGDHRKIRPTDEVLHEVLELSRGMERVLRARASQAPFRFLRADGSDAGGDPGIMRVEATRDTVRHGLLAEIDGKRGHVTEAELEGSIPFVTVSFFDGTPPMRVELEYYPVYLFVS